ncbi:MAG: hypothetical protein PHU36_08650 [Syntrophomonadaceae bacterium]|nr:hypothetical protein [Syntrophomonadaceae bacterium]
MSTWNGTEIKILVDTMRPGFTSGPLTEIPLLPDPTNLSAVSTVIQQQGRKRKRVKGKLYVETMSEFDAFEDDMNAGTEATLDIDGTTINGTYMIEFLGEPEYMQDDCVFFDVTWIEV